ncbi:MAG: hypothetical protein ACYTEQ_12645 [Planctomycetota bacterium]|jgi:hypothetical protein
MEHHFDIEDARKYGVIPAVILYNVKFWVLKNKANDRHFHDGRTWSYNSRKAFKAIFPYLSVGQIRHALEKLMMAGVLLKGNYNKVRYDRTLWYALVDEDAALEGFKPILQKPQMEVRDIANGDEGNRQPIPNAIPDTFPDKEKEKRFGEDSCELGLSKLLLDLILERKANFRRPDLQRWAVHVDRLIRVDKRTPEQIEAVIRWCQEDDFWQNNILSTEKLRKQLDRLELGMAKTCRLEDVEPVQYGSDGLTPRERLRVRLEEEKEREIEGTKGKQEYANAAG